MQKAATASVSKFDKTQISGDTHLSDFKLLLTDRKLLVSKYVTNDQDIVSYLRDLPEESRKEAFHKALKLGIVCLRGSETNQRVDYVQKEFNDLNSKFNDTMKLTAEGLQEKYEEVFGEKGKFGEILESHFGEDGKILKELFDPMKDGTPLYRLRVDFTNQIHDLMERLKISETVREMQDRTTLKGPEFENYCEELLSSITRFNGDWMDRTTDTPGEVLHSKKGDFVITLGNSEKRMVWELKHGQRYGLREICESLNEAMKNRRATYGVFFVKNVECLPRQVGWFNEIGNKLICALCSDEENEGDATLHKEVMLIAYKWAKTRLISEASELD